MEHEEFENLYLLYDPSLLLENIHNKLQTEKNQNLKFADQITNKEVTTMWSDLIAI